MTRPVSCLAGRFAHHRLVVRHKKTPVRREEDANASF